MSSAWLRCVCNLLHLLCAGHQHLQAGCCELPGPLRRKGTLLCPEHSAVMHYSVAGAAPRLLLLPAGCMLFSARLSQGICP